jgi:hypothetical protein
MKSQRDFDCTIVGICVVEVESLAQETIFMLRWLRFFCLLLASLGLFFSLSYQRLLIKFCT